MSNSSMLILLIRALLHHSPTAEYDKSLSVRDSLTASIDRSETGWSTNRARRKYQQISSLESKIHHLTHVSIYLSISIFIHLNIYPSNNIIRLYYLYIYMIICLFNYLLIFDLFILRALEYNLLSRLVHVANFHKPTKIPSDNVKARGATSAAGARCRPDLPKNHRLSSLVGLPCGNLQMIYWRSYCVRTLCMQIYIHKISIGIDRIIYII